MIDYFQSIKTQILNNVPAVNTVRLWNSQPDNPDGEIIDYPAVFLSMDQEPITYKPVQGRQIQKAVFTFTAYICDHNLTDNTNDDATEWAILTLKQDVYKVLQGFLPDGSTTALNRVMEEQDVNHGSVYVFAQSYSSDYCDEALKPTEPGSVSAVNIDGKLIITNHTFKTAPKGSTRSADGSEWIDNDNWIDNENWND